MSRSRAKGTAWESQIVRYLQDRGWPYVERRALNGSVDRGDITGIPLVMIEAKAAKAITLAAWADETTAEKANAGAHIGALWVKRRGRSSPADAYVVLTGDDFTALLKSAGY